MNPNNTCILTGRCTRDIKEFKNQDGSRKLQCTIAVPRAFLNKEGKRDSDFITMEAFMPKDKTGLGVFEGLKKGVKASFICSYQSVTYTDATGKTVYDGVFRCESKYIQESKDTIEMRALDAAAQAASAATETADAEAPAAPAEN